MHAINITITVNHSIDMDHMTCSIYELKTTIRIPKTGTFWLLRAFDHHIRDYMYR